MRNKLFDILKAICVIEIIAFWHMFDYTPINADSVVFGGDLTSCVMASFTFSSGFFLGKKHLNAIIFYKSRIKRFMIPLLISLFSLYLGKLISIKTVFLSAIGLSCFIPPQPTTLWFFSMIILFYWITPILLYGFERTESIANKVNVIIRGLIIYAFFFCFGVDDRVNQYFVFYLLGILVDVDVIDCIKDCNKYMKLILILLWLICSYIGVPVFLTDIMGVCCLIILSRFIENNSSKIGKKVFYNISYSSMFAYLFHRQIYQISKLFFMCGEGYILYIQLFITIIVIFVLSYYAQKIYDKIILKI